MYKELTDVPRRPDKSGMGKHCTQVGIILLDQSIPQPRVGNK